MIIQDLTIFKDIDDQGREDFTPLVGVVNTSGAILEPTCTTDPSGVRPYLDLIHDLGEQEVNFKEGRATIGQATARLLDKRTDPDDQGTGWFTQVLADVGGLPAVNGRRALFRTWEDGVLLWVFEGLIDDVQLESSLVKYKLVFRDTRERERKWPIFTRAPETSVLPRGFVNGYGRVPYFIDDGTPLGQLGQRYMIDPTEYLVGKIFTDVADDPRATMFWSYFRGTDWPQGPLAPPWTANPWTLDWNDGHRPSIEDTNLAFQQGMPILPVGTEGQAVLALYNNIIIEWRPHGETAWRQILHPPFFQIDRTKFMSPRPPISAVNYANGFASGGDEEKILVITVAAHVADIADKPFGDAGGWVDYRILNGGPPSEAYPLPLELNAGLLLRRIEAGFYSDINPRIRLDEARFDEMEAETPFCRGFITGMEEDGRRWTEEQWYKVLGYAPTLNELGELSPTQYKLPAADEPLLLLDDSIIGPDSSWGHGKEEAVTLAEFIFKRDYIQPLPPDWKEGDPIPSQLSRLASRDVVLQRQSIQGSLLFGDKPLNYEPTLFRSVTFSEVGEPQTGDTTDELGYQIGSRRLAEAIDRFAFSAQKIIAPCRRSGAGVKEAKQGQWVRLKSSWMPDYATHRRGLDRIGQIIRLKNKNPAWVELTILDGGPFLQAMPLPTVADIQIDSTGRLSFNVTALPQVSGVTGEVELQYYVGLALPTNEADWIVIRATLTGLRVSQLPLAAGQQVFVRYRGAGEGFRPSDWSTVTQLAIPQVPRLWNPRVVFSQTGSPLVSWSTNDVVKGVRIYYAEHPFDETAPDPLVSFIDVDDALVDSYDLDTLSAVGQAVTVQLQPWTTFVGGVAGGTSGSLSERLTVGTPPEPSDTPEGPTASIWAKTKFASSMTVQYLGALGVGGIGPLTGRRRINVAGDALGAWAAVVFGAGGEESVPRAVGKLTVVELEVTDTATGFIDVATLPVQQQVLAIDDITTYLDQDVPTAQGGYIIPGDSGGNLPPGTGQPSTEGGQPLRLARGYEEGFCRHGDVINFINPFNSKPRIRLYHGVSLSHEPRAKWSTSDAAIKAGTAADAYQATQPTYPELLAVNALNTGFEARARLRQPGAPTAAGANFGAGSNGSNPNLLTAQGQYVQLTLPALGGVIIGGKVTGHYRLRLVANALEEFPQDQPPYNELHLSVVVAIDTDNGTGWVERSTRSYSIYHSSEFVSSTDVTYNHTIDAIDTLLLAGDLVRLRLKSISTIEVGLGGTATVQLHGYDAVNDPTAGGTTQGVTWATSSNDKFANMTPEATDYVFYEAIEVTE